MISLCDFCDLAPAFCDGDADKCAVAFIKMTEQQTANNNEVTRRTIDFIMEGNT